MQIKQEPKHIYDLVLHGIWLLRRGKTVEKKNPYIIYHAIYIRSHFYLVWTKLCFRHVQHSIVLRFYLLGLRIRTFTRSKIIQFHQSGFTYPPWRLNEQQIQRIFQDTMRTQRASCQNKRAHFIVCINKEPIKKKRGATTHDRAEVFRACRKQCTRI